MKIPADIRSHEKLAFTHLSKLKKEIDRAAWTPEDEGLPAVSCEYARLHVEEALIQLKYAMLALEARR